MIKIPAAAALPLFALLFAVAGCCAGGGAVQAPGGGRTLRLAIPTDPSTLDPAQAVDVISGQIAAKMHAGLVRFDDRLAAVPDLAETVEASADGLRYRFTLREGLRFSDGGPLLAADVAASVKRLVAPASLAQRNWIYEGLSGLADYTAGKTAEIAGLAVLSSREIEFTLDAPRTDFLSRLAMPNAAVVKEKEKDAPPLGAGPFLLTGHRRGVAVTLAANPHYRGEDRHLDGVEIAVMKDSSAMYAAFESGRLDVFQIPPGLVPRFAQSAEFRARHRVSSRPKLNTYYLCLHTRSGPLADARVRRALNLALDRDEIIGKLLPGAAEAARGPIPPALRTWDPPAGFALDRDAARALLAEAGYGKEKPLRFAIHYKSNDEAGEAVMVMKSHLAAVGVEITPAPLEWSGLKARINAGEVTCAYLNWTADYPDARNFFHPLFYGPNAGPGGNRAFYASPAFDELMVRSDAAGSAAERSALYTEMENLLLQDAPWVYLWHEIEYAAARTAVEGYEVPAIYALDRATGIRFTDR